MSQREQKGELKELISVDVELENSPVSLKEGKERSQ
jgi:hypothetical protein